MAKHKPPTKPLTRLLERTNSPVYIVSPDFTIVFANDACADWTGVELASLISAKCTYDSPATSQDSPAGIAGLCPPPDLFDAPSDSNSTEREQFVSTHTPNHQLAWRRATMCPISDDQQNLLGILVICEPTDLTQPPSVDPIETSTQPQRLHAALAQIRSASQLRYSLESLVGTSPFANRLRRQFKSAVDSNSDLLIVGPAGSGKEHTARSLHAARTPSNGTDLLTIHCSIADQPLIQQKIKDVAESHSRPNRNLAPEQQACLLLLDVDRLGQAAQYELLGFFQIPDFPLRSIATTTTPLIELAENGSFLIELAHHLSTMTMELVSISRRQLDIPLLAQAILEQDNSRRDRPLSGFSKEAMRLLTEYDWPENLDQLSRTIELAGNNANSSIITEDDLPDEFIHAIQALRIGTAGETSIELDAYLAQIESELIRRALIQTHGNKSQASKILGISRPKLLRRIQFFKSNSTEPSPSVAENDDEQVDASAFEELDP